MQPWAALIVGIIAAPLALYGNIFVERKLKIDDPVGAFGIHGLNGLFGLLAVGIFADGSYGGVQRCTNERCSRLRTVSSTAH